MVCCSNFEGGSMSSGHQSLMRAAALPNLKFCCSGAGAGSSDSGSAGRLGFARQRVPPRQPHWSGRIGAGFAGRSIAQSRPAPSDTHTARTDSTRAEADRPRAVLSAGSNNARASR